MENYEELPLSDGLCRTCWFFSQGNSTCRRYGPSPGIGVYHPAAWPSVLPDDWCGEYKYGFKVILGKALAL